MGTQTDAWLRLGRGDEHLWLRDWREENEELSPGEEF